MSSQWPAADADDPSASSHDSSQRSSIHEDIPGAHTPQTSTFESPLLPTGPDGTSRSPPPPNFISSPLNPNHNPPHRHRSARQSPSFHRIASEESHALASQLSALEPGHRGSMILYKLDLAPPRIAGQRDSVASSSGASMLSLSADSKYPSGAVVQSQRGFVPYAFDPDAEGSDLPEDDDYLHVPDPANDDKAVWWSWRGIVNMSMLILLLLALLTLFVCYPVLSYFHDININTAIAGNVAVNATGQQAVRRQHQQRALRSADDDQELVLALPPHLDLHLDLDLVIDPDTPSSARTYTNRSGFPYELVFSDEFNVPNRSFTAADRFWEVVSDHPEAVSDRPSASDSVTTSNGALRLPLGSMLQTWNKLCFTRAYVVVAVSLPRANHGYEAAAWALGNLARAGYPASMDGVYAYSYDACDTNTLPSADPRNPHSTRGQRLSACTCPGEAHPGPDPQTGRGAPALDVFRASPNKVEQGAWRAAARYSAVRGRAVETDGFVTFGLDWSADAPGDIRWEAPSGVALVAGSHALDEPMSLVLRLARTPADGADADADANIGAMEKEMGGEDGMALLVDYVRVYQPVGHRNVGCSPPARPTAEYIAAHMEAYTNRSMTSWTDGGAEYAWPKNSLTDRCRR